MMFLILGQEEGLMSCGVAPSKSFFCLPKVCRVVIFGFFVLGVCASAAAQYWGPATWSDEFNGAANSPINSANWTYDTGILNVNNEVEYYCDPSSNTFPCSSNVPNAYIDGNGHLIIKAIQVGSSVVPYSGSWTSARLKSQGLQAFSYGRIESSMSLPIGPGIWPAFWGLGTNITSVGWPASGEMDFMENVPAASGLGPSAISSTLHGGNSPSNCYCGGNGMGKKFTFPSNDPNGPDVTTFHTYGAIWSANMVQFYVDDPANIFFVRTASDIPSGFTWDFNAPFFLLLNLAVGGTGSWPGPPDNTTPTPAVMTVDYVRVYTPSAVAGPAMNGPAISVTAGQTGTSTVNLSSTAGTGRVYLSCTTTAPKASCSINSSDTLNPYTVDFSTTASGTAVVSVTTTPNTAAGLQPAHPGSGQWAALAGAIFAVLTLLSPRRRWGLLGLALLLAFMPGCGGSNSGGGGGGGGSNGTPPGPYTVTVKAYTVSNGTGDPDSTTTINLIVN
jgi:beta-glucanase (GH16 family)